jgi:hypothetical protein
VTHGTTTRVTGLTTDDRVLKEETPCPRSVVARLCGRRVAAADRSEVAEAEPDERQRESDQHEP